MDNGSSGKCLGFVDVLDMVALAFKTMKASDITLQEFYSNPFFEKKIRDVIGMYAGKRWHCLILSSYVRVCVWWLEASRGDYNDTRSVVSIHTSKFIQAASSPSCECRRRSNWYIKPVRYRKHCRKEQAFNRYSVLGVAVLVLVALGCVVRRVLLWRCFGLAFNSL